MINLVSMRIRYTKHMDLAASCQNLRSVSYGLPRLKGRDQRNLMTFPALQTKRYKSVPYQETGSKQLRSGLADQKAVFSRNSEGWSKKN